MAPAQGRTGLAETANQADGSQREVNTRRWSEVELINGVAGLDSGEDNDLCL